MKEEKQESKDILDNLDDIINSISYDNTTLETAYNTSINSIYTSNSSSGSVNLGGSLSTGTTLSTTNPNWNISTGSYNSYGYNNWNISTTYDFISKDMAIDIEKLLSMSKDKRDMLEEILQRFISESEYTMKELLYNTLESYGLITDKKSLERRAKISNVLDDEKN
jgi:hypothetical protein